MSQSVIVLQQWPIENTLTHWLIHSLSSWRTPLSDSLTTFPAPHLASVGGTLPDTLHSVLQLTLCLFFNAISIQSGTRCNPSLTGNIQDFTCQKNTCFQRQQIFTLKCRNEWYFITGNISSKDFPNLSCCGKTLFNLFRNLFCKLLWLFFLFYFIVILLCIFIS